MKAQLRLVAIDENPSFKKIKWTVSAESLCMFGLKEALIG